MISCLHERTFTGKYNYSLFSKNVFEKNASPSFRIPTELQEMNIFSSKFLLVHYDSA